MGKNLGIYTLCIERKDVRWQMRLIKKAALGNKDNAEGF